MPRALKTVSRFETETLATDENLAALQAINHAWVGKAMRVTKAGKIILDMDSSESPVHGGQEEDVCEAERVNDFETPA